MVTEEEAMALVGKQFPGGTFKAEPYFVWLLTDVVKAPELLGSEFAHPVLVYLAQAGMGLSLRELFLMFLGTTDDGPMQGEWEMEQFQPMKAGVTYSVTGGIIDVKRKQGQKTGVFDVITFELRIREQSKPDVPVAVTRSGFIWPRRG